MFTAQKGASAGGYPAGIADGRLLGAADADEVFALDRRDANRNALAGGFDHLSVADVDAEVVDGIAKEHEVAERYVSQADASRRAELFNRGTRNVYPCDSPCRL